jgi:FKBP-type peptidyl-prolyl cis-trans isomerase
MTRTAIGLAILMLALSTACEERFVKVAAPSARVLSETIGSGVKAHDGSIVTIRYTLSKNDGTTVLQDNNYTFELGAHAVIAAVDDAVRGMNVGGRRVVECPPETHWGRAGYGGKIEPNTTLKLDVQLLAVE